jgi:cupin fold WbuC family metalloprotein
MLIVHTRETYVRPHKHPGKSESFHLIEGEVDIVFFDNEGKMTDVIAMGDYSSGKTFYYRIATPIYHTLLIRSDVIVFHEATNGPFRPQEMVFAPWEPDPTDSLAVSEFIRRLAEGAERFATTQRETQ